MIYHDTEAGNYSRHKNVNREINYEFTQDQIIALMDVSHTCRQFISVDTYYTQITGRYSYKKWSPRSGGWATNWGTPTGVHGCPCSVQQGKIFQKKYHYHY